MSDLLNSASLVMIPSGYKEDVVYSQIPTDGSGDLSFTRASNGTRVNSAGLVEVCPWNLLQYSEDFANGVWVQDNNIITSNSIIAPNGTTTGETISNSATTALFRTYQYISGYGQPQTLTFSTYFKYKDHRYISFGLTDDSDYRSQVVVDLQNMVITENYKFFSGDVLTSSIENVGNGWYRIVGTFTYNTALAGGNLYLLYKFQTSGTFSSLGTFQTGTGVYIWGAQLNIGSTAKPYFPTTDRLNVPRLTYQNGGGGCPSLLLEKQSTNLALQSQSFASPWSTTNYLGTNPVVSTNYGISPDGTQNATRIQLARTNTNDSYSQIYQYPISVTSGQQYTWSVWLKALSGTPTISIIGDFGRPSVTLTSEWVRYTGTGTANASQTQLEIAILGSNYASGNSLSADFLAWGYQFEQSSYATSYIPTTSSSATRVADACYKTGISSLIGQTEGVIFWDIDVEVLSATGNENILNIDAGSYGNTIYLIKGSTGILTAEIYVTGVVQCSFSLSLPSVGRYKMALAYKANDFAFYVNGVSRGTDTSGSVPATSRLQLGNGVLGPSDGKTNQCALFPTRLTNAELASLTTI